MKIFVTGGSGFIGRRLLQLLSERGDEVFALARSPESASVISDHGAHPVSGDLGNVAAMAEGMRDCRVVFHLAANVRGFAPLADMLRDNVEGTENVLEAMRRADVPRLVYVSTEAVLAGPHPILNADENRPFPRKPVGHYSLTKGMAEKKVLAASSSALSTVVLRPRLVWGPGEKGILPRLVDAVHRRRFRWIDNGRYLTSTCHVDNVCEGMLLAAEKGPSGAVYFLTDGAPVSFRNFITTLLRTQRVEPGGKSISPLLAKIIARAGETVWKIFRFKGEPPLSVSAVRLLGEEVTVNDQKARRELGYQGKLSREAGLRELMAAGQVERKSIDPVPAR